MQNAQQILAGKWPTLALNKDDLSFVVNKPQMGLLPSLPKEKVEQILLVPAKYTSFWLNTHYDKKREQLFLLQTEQIQVLLKPRT